MFSFFQDLVLKKALNQPIHVAYFIEHFKVVNKISVVKRHIQLVVPKLESGAYKSSGDLIFRIPHLKLGLLVNFHSKQILVGEYVGVTR
jgi:hypothetical protein